MSSTPTGTELDQRHLAAIEALASGLPFTRAAVVANVNERTVREWMRWPVFKTALDAACEDVLAGARSRLKTGAERAVQNLLDRVENGDIDASLALLDRIGLAKGAKIEHSGPGGGAVQVDLRAAVREALRSLPDSDVVPE